MRAALIVLGVVACGSKASAPPPELDAAAWQHVQELAKPARPNGPTKDLEAAIAIATRNDWSNRVRTGQPMPEVEPALEAVRRWRAANGGAVLLALDTPDVSSSAGPLVLGILESSAADAIPLATEIGQRTIEQADSMLNASVGFGYLKATQLHAKRVRQPVLIDMQGWRRAVVRGIAAEVVWLRKLRERSTDPNHRGTKVSADLENFDANLRGLVEVLRGVEPGATEAQLIARLEAADRRDPNLAKVLDAMIEMVKRWQDDAALIFVP